MNRLSVRDVITTVILSVLLIVMQLVINAVCMLNHFVSMVFTIGILFFACAPVYVLMVRRVAKRFVTLIYLTMVGLMFLIMGNWFLLPYLVIVGLLCEIVLWKEASYQNYRRISAAWILQGVLYTGVNLLPLWFFWEDFEKTALASGMSQDYIDSYVGYYSRPLWILAIALINLICAVLGCLFAGVLMKKHFTKAGVL
ncbi:MAG: MptD family putative ECF transporter S component [Spirochaetaceae bacterium]|jgi:energy-coupling factor transport system substrate-specific component|nr:MptD family putative ECF transporter S component [Spirochaetaceae bacterium]